MRKYILLFIFPVLLLPINGQAQSVDFSLANPMIVPMGIDTFYEVDVLISTQVPEDSFLMSSGQLYFNYNPQAFGMGVATLGNVSIFFNDPAYLLNLKETQFGLLNIYSLLPINDNTPSRVSIAWAQDRAGNCISQRINMNPVPLFRLRLRFLPGATNMSPDVCFESLELFTNQTYSACGPFAGPCDATVGANCTNFPGVQIFNDVFSCNLLCGVNGISQTSSASASSCSEGPDGWVHLTNNSGEVILSVNPHGNDLGLLDAETYLDPVVNIINGDAYLQRHYRLSSTNPVVSPVSLRVFFTDQEFNNLVSAAMGTPNPFDDLLSISELAATKYSGPTEDGIFDPSDATSLELITPVAFGNQFGANFMELSVNSFSELWLHSGNSGILPIELLIFGGEIVTEGILLNWKTGTEVNTGHFDIERSQDGLTFEAIGRVTAAGWSDQEIGYQLLDENPQPGKNYYRLRIVDRGGGHEFSHIISFNFDLIIVEGIHPNPLSGEVLEFNMVSQVETSLGYQILDITGKTILSGFMSVDDGQHKYKIATGPLADGVYILQLSGSDYHFSWRFVKAE